MATIESLSLVDLSAGEVWTVSGSGSAQAEKWLTSPEVAAAGATGESQVFQASPAHLESGHPALSVVATPVGSTDPANRWVLVGEVHLRQGERGLVPLPHFSATSNTTIVDHDGHVLASSNGKITEVDQEHQKLISVFQSTSQPGVEIHHPSQGKSHVVAFAPLETVSAGVIVEEREDVVLAVPQELRRNLLVFGVLTLALTSVVAWLHAARTMRPVKKLTAASGAIAPGVLDQPVRIYRNDEIGALARSFEIMRQKLLEAERQRLHWEQDMERRVEERTEQVHGLLTRIISAQEEERKRVARELHDQVAQDLAAMLITLQGLAQDPAGLQEAERASLQKVQEHLGGTLKEMRRMILDLRPSALDDLGLDAAIRSYAESRVEGTGLSVHYETAGAVPPLDSLRQTALFRVVQEAISNVVRHAEAKHLSIKLEFSQGGARAVVEDDGKGFDVDSIAQAHDSTKRLGILGIKERTALLSGSVEIESRPGEGSKVRVWIPLSD